VQLRLLPRFLALRFSPAFWAFTFSWAAAATDALSWIALRRPPGATVYATVILAVITAFIGYIAARTVVLIARGQLLPPSAVPPVNVPSLAVPPVAVPSAAVPPTSAEVIPNEATDPHSLALAAGAPVATGARQVTQH
jgi:hypothetical protein